MEKPGKIYPVLSEFKDAGEGIGESHLIDEILVADEGARGDEEARVDEGAILPYPPHPPHLVDLY